MFALDDYDYHLPDRLIAHYPAASRDRSRLLRLDRQTGGVAHHRFSEFADMLRPGDLLVVNNTRVIPGRLYGKKETGGNVEVLVLNYAQGRKNQRSCHHLECDALIRASKRPKNGTRIFFGKDFEAVVLGFSDGVYQIRLTSSQDIDQALHDAGNVPLPPYIRREEAAAAFKDENAYQTVYASEKGAVAAPTAGLHFTRDLLARLAAGGVDIAEITLHVGHGTFLPVRTADIRQHNIHSEWFSIPENVAQMVRTARENGNRVVAVGTTSVRTLEYAAAKDGTVAAGSGSCDLYIYPGYEFKCVDAMVTNFHLPRSTLLMLVSAFAGRKNVLAAYEAAIAAEYRFYSYGDAMFIS